METNPRTWVIVGASRGIGLELVKQLLERGEQVVAAVRKLSAAPKLFELIESQRARDRCTVEQCDIASDESISVRRVLFYSASVPRPALERQLTIRVI